MTKYKASDLLVPAEVLNKCGVYAIHCYCSEDKEGTLIYIGSTQRSFLLRWTEHIQALKQRKHSNRKLQNLYTRLNGNTFRFSILQELPSDLPTRKYHNIELFYINQQKELGNKLLTNFNIPGGGKKARLR